MEGAPRSCEDKHFVLYKSHFLWTQEAYQHHKEPQWGSEIQANTAAPPTTYLCYPHMPCPFACSCSIMCAPVSVRGCPCRCPLPLGGLTLHRDFDKVLIK